MSIILSIKTIIFLFILRLKSVVHKIKILKENASKNQKHKPSLKNESSPRALPLHYPSLLQNIYA